MRYSRRMIREGSRPHGRMLKESRDGWDRDNEIIQQLIDDTLTKIYELKYELENCVRGSYTECETYSELAEYIRDLGEELSGYYNDIYDIEDEKEEEEDEDEEDEDSENNVRESHRPHGRMLKEDYRKVNQRQLKQMVRDGFAEDITNIGFGGARKLREEEGYLEIIGTGYGVYGVNCAWLKGRNTGTNYVITARNSTLESLV